VLTGYPPWLLGVIRGHASCGLAGLWFPLAISKGRGAWLAAAAGGSGSRGAARRGHLSNVGIKTPFIDVGLCV
jgi:hypothetical protein